VAEDNGGHPLPRRVPGTKRRPETGPLARPVLSESDLQRIRAALDSAQAQAAAPPAERAAPLPRRARRASNGSAPPAHTARPELPAALLPTSAKEAPTEPPPAVPGPRPVEATEETERQPDVTAGPGPAAATPAGPQLVLAQRGPAQEQEERQDHPDEQKAGPDQKTASREPETASQEQETGRREEEAASKEEMPTVQKNGQASLEKAQLHGTRALTRRPKPAPPPPPRPAGPKSAPPTASAFPPVPAGPRKRGHGRAIITGSAIATLVLLSAGSALLLTQHAGRAKARTDASAEVAVRDRAAGWVASQVGRADLISCDQAMCRALRARHVPADDLLVLKPGGVGPLHSAVVVVTAAVKKIVGSKRLSADAPAAIASFGSGADRIVIGVVFPRGAAAYAAALRKEIADRKTAGSSLLLLGPVTATAAARQELQDGQVDSRLLLTLAELASQWPVSIMAFGERAPGASPGIPFRSADLVVTDSKAGPAPAGGVRVMSDFVHQLGDYFASARIGTVRLASGLEVVRIEFKAPGRFGLLGASTR
jgi:hypothetical protein